MPPRKKGARKRKHAAHPAVQGPVPHSPSCDVDGRSSGKSAELEDFPCTFFCDLLCGLPSLAVEGWDEENRREISSQLIKCHLIGEDRMQPFLRCCIGDTVWKRDEDTVWVDIRGRYIDEAIELLMIHLHRCLQFSDVKNLCVIVGCAVHGVGKGILKQAIIDLLDRDKTIEKDTEGSVILIEVAGRKDFKNLGWVQRMEIVFR